MHDVYNGCILCLRYLCELRIIDELPFELVREKIMNDSLFYFTQVTHNIKCSNKKANLINLFL